MNLTLQDQYNLLVSTNLLYQRNRDQWHYLLNSYMGGIEYSRANLLTKYVNETTGEYQARIAATHLENHCKSVIATYVSFLFREEPEREFYALQTDLQLENFLEDCDMDGRSFDDYMKQVSIWASVFGHVWTLIVKPNIGQITKGDEISADVRPYLNLLSPLLVSDWTWTRRPNGRYVLTYFKYIEDANDSVSTIREWFPNEIHTWQVDHTKRTVMSHEVEVNPLGEIPAVITYNQKSPVRGLGVSDIADIANAQKTIYNLSSEVEQSIRINGHPALVKTAGAEASAGAGAIIQIEDNMDPGLKPYMLSVATDIGAIFTAIKHTVEAIDKMANTGSIRSSAPTQMSGVAQEQEFALLNAKLSEKADQLELTEEAIWQWYAYYQGTTWAGEVKYPNSFNIKDSVSEIQQLQMARSAATDPRVIELIDKKIVEWLGEDPNMLSTPVDPASIPEQPPFDIHVMIDPATGKEYYARTEQEHLDMSALGYYHKEES